MRKVRLSTTTPTPAALADLKLGDVVYLDGLMYTAREGVYRRALEDTGQYPDGTAAAQCRQLSLLARGNRINRRRQLSTMGAVTATGSVPVCQVARRMAGQVRRQAGDRQGRHVAGNLS